MCPLQWPAEAIWQAVEPGLPGFTVEVLHSVDSTNGELMRRARAGQLEPALLVAERQTVGRGRLGRVWHSDVQGSGGSLTFSLGLPFVAAQWSGLSLAVGLSVAQSLHPELRIKWPNDLWLSGRKLGGILIETTSVAETRYAVVGVGINITAPEAVGLHTLPAALCEWLPLTDAAMALERIAVPLVTALQRFGREGFAPLQAAFHQRDALYGQEVVCSDGTTGLACGVDAQGALLVQSVSGLKRIAAAEVSVRPLAQPSLISE